MLCDPVRCTRCGDDINCGDRVLDLNSGWGRPTRRLLCGKGDCTAAYGRWLTHACTTRCYWRHRRPHVVKSRRCPECRKPFTPRRSDAVTCSDACRQAKHRRLG